MGYENIPNELLLREEALKYSSESLSLLPVYRAV